ncbi:MAG: hypothetical protein WD737_05210 [Gemmatimonadota bacterium]
MTKFIKQFSTLSVLAMSLFLWSCDNIGQTTAPTGDLNPRGYAIFSSTTGEQFVVIRESEDLGIVSGSIGAAGGELHLGNHSLYVPEGAVEQSTVFTMSRADDELVRLRLSATVNDHNDVGSAGFEKPVRLTISFSGAEDLPESTDKLEVIYFRPDGLVDPQSTWLDVSNESASGELPHFSDFGLAWPF